MRAIKEIMNFAFSTKPNRGNIGGAYRVYEDGTFELFYAGFISEENGYSEPLLLRYGCSIDIPKEKLHKALEEYLATHEIKDHSIREMLEIN